MICRRCLLCDMESEKPLYELMRNGWPPFPPGSAPRRKPTVRGWRPAAAATG